jgi:hypothetical protein
MYAFPSGHNPKTGTQESGMKLRDYFAAAAMQALIQRDESNIASEAYRFADEMLKARDE